MIDFRVAQHLTWYIKAMHLIKPNDQYLAKQRE